MSFGSGQHVIIHTDEEVVAGHLVGYDEDLGGFMVRVTHRMKPVVREVSEVVGKAVVAELERYSDRKLKLMIVLARRALWKSVLSMDHAELVEVGHLIVEEQMVEQMPQYDVLTPLKSPVLTFFNTGFIQKMEATEDKNTDALLSQLDFKPSGTVDNET